MMFQSNIRVGSMKWAGLGLLLLIILAACSPQPASSERNSSVDEQQIDVELRDLGSVQAFSEVFNEDIGKPRLMLLLSPT